MMERIDLPMSPFGLVPRLELVSTSPTGTEPHMSRRRYFGHAALALACTMALTACSSDTPTSPPTAAQSLTQAAPTIATSNTRLFLYYPAVCIPASFRCYWRYPYAYLSISNTGGGTLNWTSTKSTTWIKRSPTYGTAPSTMKVWVDGTGLPTGTYYGRLKVWATGATNSPQTVYITMYRH
jgi:hypothetical protein